MLASTMPVLARLLRGILPASGPRTTGYPGGMGTSRALLSGRTTACQTSRPRCGSRQWLLPPSPWAVRCRMRSQGTGTIILPGPGAALAPTGRTHLDHKAGRAHRRIGGTGTIILPGPGAAPAPTGRTHLDHKAGRAHRRIGGADTTGTIILPGPGAAPAPTGRTRLGRKAGRAQVRTDNESASGACIIQESPVGSMC